jgi:hypothetical protein
MKIYIITTVTTFIQQGMSYKIIHNGKMTSSLQHATHLEPPMPDEISGMGKTNGNASLICKNNHVKYLKRIDSTPFELD